MMQPTQLQTTAPARARTRRVGRFNPWDGLMITMAAFMLVSMARVHSFVPGMALIRPAMLLAVVSIALFFMQNDSARSIRHLRHPFTWLAIFFVGWAILGAPFGMYTGRSVRFLLENFSRNLGLAVLLAACMRSIDDARRLLMALAVGGMIFALFAALPAGMKAVSAGGYDPNDSAMLLTLTFPLILYFAIREKRFGLKLLFALALLVCTIGIVRTGSRGGFLAFVAVIGYTIFFFQGVKPIVRVLSVASVVGIMAVAATGEYWQVMQTINDPTDYNQTSPTGRKAIWERARWYMAQDPALGAGINNFSVAEGRHPMIAASIASGRGFKYSTAHSMWYQVGAELGYPGLAAFIGLFGAAFLYLRRLTVRARKLAHIPQMRDVAGLAAALIGSLVAIIVSGTFLSQAYSSMVWGTFGLILGLLKVTRFEGLDVTSKAPARPTARGARPMRKGFSPRPRHAAGVR